MKDLYPINYDIDKEIEGDINGKIAHIYEW